MSRPIAVAAFSWLLLQPASAQVALSLPAPEIGAGFPGFVVALGVAYLAERRSRRKS